MATPTGFFYLAGAAAVDVFYIYMRDGLSVLDMLGVEDNNVGRDHLSLLEVKDVPLLNLAPRQVRHRDPVSIDY